MAVLIEGANIIIRKDLAKIVPDFTFTANATVTDDGQLIRVGFLSEDNAVKYANELANKLHQAGVKTPTNYIAYVLHELGIQGDCDWLEIDRAELNPAENIEICWLKGEDPDQVAVPDGWKYEGSLSQTKLRYSKADFEKQHTYLSTKGCVETWRNNETGQEVFIDVKE